MNSDVLKSTDKVFFDTAFLASFCIDEHPDFTKAQTLLTKIILRKCAIYTSPLCFYELWQIIKEYKDYQRNDYKLLRKVNKVFREMTVKNIRLKLVFDCKNFSYKDVVHNLREATELISKSVFISVANLEKEHVSLALDAIENYDQKPGDAFHFSVMKKVEADYVITGNKKDFEKMGKKVIWF